jgi:hypothetical protein
LAAYARGPWDILIGHPECNLLGEQRQQASLRWHDSEGGPEADRWAAWARRLTSSSRSGARR